MEMVLNSAYACSMPFTESIILSELVLEITEGLHYCKYHGDDLHKGKDGMPRYWIQKSLACWNEIFPFYSERTIQRAFAYLVKNGIVLSEHICDNKRDNTNSYAVDFEALESHVAKNYKEYKDAV